MAPKATVKREDLVVPYVHVPLEAESTANGIVQQTMPMAAMFMKNKLLSWFSLFSAVQAVLSEWSGVPVPEGGQPAYLRVLLGLVGLGVCYMELVWPGSSGYVPRPKAVAETVAAAATA